ncbi:DNA (cytosine-5-)-methyltransferase [Aphanothece hegewaldii CCALA 016]|uniref:DNA (cytosine-5-)-methyltransferase n=1 Tax=Aphanothece hegewaldii CCALA 016 TaxID=2107694 RepID=A0A2T1M1M0_9CHRO|nr:DNA (cytosine-5-)-methyltransferase [Aphanothece hegewaldii]PSF38590.1 DNA (cytosine-5-)-methyltransferase [Aphanothece hegewaldii CCALA 016]
MNENYSNNKLNTSPYTNKINSLLKPKINHNLPLVMDLFAGCGGLSLGFEAQGFLTVGYEINRDACLSYSQNLQGDCLNIKLTEYTELPNPQIIIGGVPCQPFSVSGKQKGLNDTRDGFPIFISAVKRYQPKLFLIENVRGLFYRNKPYLEKIITQLRQLDYLIEVDLLNSVWYDTPQNRERVFIVGHRGKFKFPQKINIKISAGEALGDLAVFIPPESNFLTPSMDSYIIKYEKASHCSRPRDLHLDQPARTVTCRNLAGATGDMQRIKLPDGRRRRLIPLEAARLQSFPDWFKFNGSEQSVFNQIGNAVPPMLAYYLAKSCKDYFELNFFYDKNEIIAKNISITNQQSSQQLSLF